MRASESSIDFRQHIVDGVRLLSLRISEPGFELQKMVSDYVSFAAVSGSVWTADVDGKRLEETPGHLLTRNLGSVFQVRATSVERAGGGFRGVFLPPDVIANCLRQQERAEQTLEGPPIVKNQHIRSLALDLHQTLSTSSCRLERTSALIGFTAAFLENQCAKRRSPAISPRSLSIARDYIHDNFDQQIAIDDLAGLTGLNAFVLIRQFKTMTGLAPYQYLQSYRISKAKNYLAAGLKLSDVVANCGFYDQSHFNRVFKRFSMGLSPGRYRSRKEIVDQDLV